MKQVSIKNAHQNNLRIQSLDIPLNKLVLFSGPSGSGKSSLAIETILQEGQRRCFNALKASFPLYHQSPRKPNVDSIDNLPPTFGMKQDIGITFNKFESVSSMIAVDDLLEQLFMQYGTLHCPKTNVIMPYFTSVEVVDNLFDKYLHSRIAVLCPVSYTTRSYKDVLVEIQTIGIARVVYDDKMMLIEELPESPPKKLLLVLDRLKVNRNNRIRCLQSINQAYRSRHKQVIIQIGEEQLHYYKHPFSTSKQEFIPIPTTETLSRDHSLGACKKCAGLGEAPPRITCLYCLGTGLSDASDHLYLDNISYRKLMQLPIEEVAKTIQSLKTHPTLQNEIIRRINLLIEVGLGTLSLSRRIITLSTGERSRTRLISVLCNQLGQALYILDEPSLGLSSNEVSLIIKLMKKYIQNQQSFIIVDHHPLFQKYCDLNIIFGPGSGKLGGSIGNKAIPNTTLTKDEKTFRDHINLTSPLKGMILTGGINVYSGPSGSGKSTLLELMPDALTKHFTTIYALNQKSRSGNKRSCLATISKLWGPIRTLLANTKQAKMQGLNPGHFSFNRSGGRCEHCYGLGATQVQMPPLPPAEIKCTTCGGLRFSEDILTVTYRNNTITDILDKSVDENLQLFANHPVLFHRLKAMSQVGIGYLKLGQSTPSLSGGENRRIQIAHILEQCYQVNTDLPSTVLIIDDPTAALHSTDASCIQQCLLELRKQDVTIVIASQNKQMIDIADNVVAV
jgi:excinuclease ABC subunit A